MPIEIKELHIKTVIDNTAQENNQAAANNASGGSMPPDKLIELCVEKVLEIIKEKAER